MTDALRGAYRVMRTIRVFEECVRVDFPGFGSRYAGEEALTAGVCRHLDGRDAIAGIHRSHGHRIAKGVGVRAIMAELQGRRTGSRKIIDFSNGTLGCVPLLVCGTALAAKQQNTGGVGVAFLGDDAVSPGTTLEALTLASTWNLPVVFVAEDTGYADRVGGLGVPGVIVDGSDFFAVHEAAGEAVDRARGGGGPTLIEAGFPQPVEGGVDCLQRFRARVTDTGELAEYVLDDIDAEVATLIADAASEANSAPKPTPNTPSDGLETDGYISY
jgi:pyruvate dehydrogenase E1 component alpha subunit